jgi:hypothetical protein
LRLTEKYLGPIPLAAGLAMHDIVGRLRGISPADLKALVSTASTRTAHQYFFVKY